MSFAGLNENKLGGFILERELGRGASATIYLAHKPDSDEKLSLKVFHPRLFQDAHFARRILREFKVVRSLNHPNIVAVRDFLSELDPPALVMDFIDGDNLEKFQCRLPYTLPEVSVLIAIEILKALEYSHSKQVVHRDLKPENILISRHGRVFVTDFGLARFQEAATILTQPNHIVGSPDYMSPEQASGEVVSTGSDLFSLASILYFLTTGTRPFSRGTPVATLNAIRQGDLEAPEKRNPKISGELSRLIQRGLAKDPANRFATAKEFQDALTNYLAKLGLGEEVFAFPFWMADPSGLTMESLRNSVEQITLNAEAAAKERKWNELLESIAHLSLKAPQSPSIPRLMDSMKRSRVGYWKWGAIASVIFGLLVTYFLVKNHNERRAAAAVPTQIEQALPSTAPAPVSVPDRAPPRTVSTEVRFNISPDIDVFWDGKPIDATLPLHEKVIGNHELMLKRKGFASIRRKVMVSGEEPVVINVQ